MDFKAKRFSCIHVKDFSKREKPTNYEAGSWAFIRQQQSILNYFVVWPLTTKESPSKLLNLDDVQCSNLRNPNKLKLQTWMAKD